MNGKRICKTCNDCKILYRRSPFGFWKFRRYYCERFCRLISVGDCCDSWRAKRRAPDCLAERFAEAESAAKYLLGVFKDD